MKRRLTGTHEKSLFAPMRDLSHAGGSEADDAAPPFVVDDLERVEAPPPHVFLERYLRPRRPVIVTRLTDDGWLRPEHWTLERMATRYGAARVVAADLKNGTLLDDQASGVVFRRLLLREFLASLADPREASHYVMAPTWNFPATFERDYRVPRYCAGASHLRAKVSPDAAQCGETQPRRWATRGGGMVRAS